MKRKKASIRYSAFEPKSTFDRYNALIKEDQIDATPTCVIIRAGKKGKFVGRPAPIRSCFPPISG